MASSDETDDNDNEKIFKEINEHVNKTRISLFIPNTTVYENEKQLNAASKLYLEKIHSEESAWKQVYNNVREERKLLISKLKKISAVLADFSNLDEADIKYLNEAPDFLRFVRESNDLQSHIKIFNEQVNILNLQKCSEIKQLRICAQVLEDYISF